jgi:hypothetical protein
MAQKWLFWLVALGAGALVLANPNAYYKVAEGTRRLTAGSVVQVATLGKGNVT